MIPIEIESVLIFNIPEDFFLDIVRNCSGEQREQINDRANMVNGVIVDRRCWARKETIEEIIGRSLPVSLQLQTGFSVLLEQMEFLNLFANNPKCYKAYETAIEAGQIEDIGVIRGKDTHFDFIGRRIVGSTEILSTVFPRLGSILPAS